MGKRGPAPKPTALKILEGNPGKRKLNKNEPKPEKSDLICPTWLSFEAKREWKRIVPELQRLGVATKIDQSRLEQYCMAWGTWLDAQKQIEKEGQVLMRPTGSYYPNPYIKIANDASKECLVLAREFGLTPSSRSRIELPEAAQDDEDEKEFFS